MGFMARNGGVWSGEVRFGMTRILRCGQAGFGRVRYSLVGRGWVWFGEAWVSWLIAVRFDMVGNGAVRQYEELLARRGMQR